MKITRLGKGYIRTIPGKKKIEYIECIEITEEMWEHVREEYER